MSFDEGHVNQAEFPEAAAAVQQAQAREEYSAGEYITQSHLFCLSVAYRLRPRGLFKISLKSRTGLRNHSVMSVSLVKLWIKVTVYNHMIRL